MIMYKLYWIVNHSITLPTSHSFLSLVWFTYLFFFFFECYKAFNIKSTGKKSEAHSAIMNYTFILVQDEGWLFLELFFCLVFLYKWKKNEWDEFTWINWSVFTRLLYKTSCPLHINTYNIILSPVLTGTNTSYLLRDNKRATNLYLRVIWKEQQISGNAV